MMINVDNVDLVLGLTIYETQVSTKPRPFKVTHTIGIRRNLKELIWYEIPVFVYLKESIPYVGTCTF